MNEAACEKCGASLADKKLPCWVCQQYADKCRLCAACCQQRGREGLAMRTALIGTAAVTPIHDQVIVRRIEQAMTAGGLHIPDTADQQRRSQEAEVLAVGEGRLTDKGCRIPMACKTGDRVIIPKFVGKELSIDREVVTILRDTEVLAVIERATVGVDVGKKPVFPRNEDDRQGEQPRRKA